MTSIEMLKSLAADFAAVSSVYDGVGVTDPYDQLKEWRETSPVRDGDILKFFKVPSQADWAHSGRHIYTLFRYADVIKVLRDPENWRSSLNGEGFGPAVDGFLLTAMDGEEHKHWRGVMQRPMFAESVAKWDATLVRPIVNDEFIGVMRPRGGADLLAEFTLPMPLRVIYKMFGFEDDPEAVFQTASWALRVLGGPRFDPAESAVTVPQAMEAGQKMYEYVLGQVEKRRASGLNRDDLIGFLFNLEIDGKKFTNHDVATFIRMLLLAAGETTSRTLANFIVHLFRFPEVMERLRQDRSLILKALTESMRYDTVAGHLARLANKDMEIGGVTIKKGDAVTLCISAANRDPEVYENPDKFDIDRPMRPVMSFGFGPHICMGMHIARLEIDAAIDALLDLPNLRLDPDYPTPVIRGIQLRGPDQLHVKWDV